MPTAVRNNAAAANAPARVVVRRDCAALSAIHVQAAQIRDRLSRFDLADRRTDGRHHRLDLGVRANHERDGVLGELRRGQIQRRTWIAIETSAACTDAVIPTDVLDNAHYFMSAAVELENSTDRVRVGPEPSRESLADNRDQRRALLILHAKLTSASSFTPSARNRPGLTTCSTTDVGALDDMSAAARSRSVTPRRTPGANRTLVMRPTA
jgi:hypothetical protein